MVISKIRKRDGRIVDFDQTKITIAIWKASQAVDGVDRKEVEKLTEKIVEKLEGRLKPEEVPSVEQVQDIVEETLIHEGHAKTAKAYILYRQKRAKARRAKAALGVEDELKLPTNSLYILAARYLQRDEERKITESTAQMFRRVARAMAEVESGYGKSEEEVKKLEEEFYRMMTNFEFLPNSPTLMNAGIEDGLNLSACFVIPVGDSIEEIFNALKTMALVQKAGGGCIESGSRVFTTHCGVERIENLYEELSRGKEGIRLKNKEFVDVSREDVKTPSFDKDTGEVRFKKVSKIWKYQIPKEKTVKIEGTGRFEATVSEWHPFFVYENGIVKSKRADEIKKDDLILLPNKSIKKRWPFKAYRKIEGIELDEKLAWLTGLFFSDGSIDDDSPAELRIRIFNSDKKVIQKTLRVLKEITGVSYTPQEDDRSKETVYRIAVYDRSLTKAIRKMNQGRIGRKELNVRIPEEIFKSPISVIGAFLAGLTDGDGHVQLNKRQIEYSMSSKDFICDLSALLYLLGIRSRFRERKDKRDENWEKMYEVAVSGYENFKELAGLLGEHLTIEEKKRRVEEHLKNQHSSTTCPLSFDQFRSFLEEIGINVTCRRFWKKSIKIGGRKFFLGRWRGTNRISRIRVISLINELLRNYKGKLSEKSIKELRRLGNILPSLTKVKKVKRCVSEKTFYDLTVEDTNNYFSGKKGLAIIHNTGYSFSKLRPKGDIVKSTGGVASGPISFMKIFDAATEQIKQGGKRRGANMGMLRVDHPDILDFIVVKEKEGTLSNFNISVAITDKFMKALKKDEDFELINPRNGEVVKKVKARAIWNLIVTMAWKNGEPGIVFIDRINEHCNTTPKLGKIESTNPCVAGDTLVYTSKGIYKAKDLCEEDPEVIVDGRLDGKRSLRSTPVFKTGKKKVYKLITKEGYEVNLTRDHKVRTERGWVEAKDLKKGDKIWILDRKGGFGQEGSYELGICLGWLIGDGNVSDGRGILNFYDEEKKELAPKFAKAINKVVEGVQKIDREIGVIDVGKRAEVKSVRFKRIAERMGLTENKFQVPPQVFKGSEAMQRGFLQALFTADGSVQGKLEKGVSIRLWQSNLSLLKDVQKLLLNFGIASKIYQGRKLPCTRLMPDGHGGLKEYECKTQHELVISKENLRTFKREIGFLLKRKNKKLENKLNSFTKGPYSEHFTATFKKLEGIGKRIVYDLTEPRTHSFIANGFVVHNCAEQPLLPYESCNLGSINLSKMLKEEDEKYKIDWEKLRETVRLAVRFLDNVIDANIYPIEEIKQMTKGNRKIGLGVMGFADMLILLGIPYNSKKALQLAEKVMKSITDEARKVSVELGKEKGSFPNFKGSRWDKLDYKTMRNATVTTIAPTGTISEIAGCSQGIEPLFSIGYVRSVAESLGTDLVVINPYFEQIAIRKGFYSEAVMKKVLSSTSVQGIEEIPKSVRKIFVTALDLEPEDHVKMQAAFQKHVDNSISKTVNFPTEATPDDVERVYMLAYKLGCLGVTIYRFGSRKAEVLKPLPKGLCEVCEI